MLPEQPLSEHRRCGAKTRSLPNDHSGAHDKVLPARRGGDSHCCVSPVRAAINRALPSRPSTGTSSAPKAAVRAGRTARANVVVESTQPLTRCCTSGSCSSTPAGASWWSARRSLVGSGRNRWPIPAARCAGARSSDSFAGRIAGGRTRSLARRASSVDHLANALAVKEHCNDGMLLRQAVAASAQYDAGAVDGAARGEVVAGLKSVSGRGAAPLSYCSTSPMLT